MVSSLDDIVPDLQTVKVEIGSKEVEVQGVSGRNLAALMRRFPELKAQIAGRELSEEDRLIMGLDAAPAIIAAGFGKCGDAVTEGKAERLKPEDQMKLVEAIMKLSMPDPSPIPQPPAGADDTAGTVVSK